MRLEMGVIVIGSLFWDQSDVRKSWRKELAIHQKLQALLPIRYGRKSRVDGDRKGTYTMVFSHSMKTHQHGRCLIIPYNKSISSSEEFQRQALLLAEAEGISNQSIGKNWGTVAIAINPFLEQRKQEVIEGFWRELAINIPNRMRPDIRTFGEDLESKSITDGLVLNIELGAFFKAHPHIDALFAACNAIKLDEHGTNRYPTLNSIALEIYRNDYYDYFLNNRLNGITTFQDRKIARILKRKYKVKLRPRMTALKLTKTK